MEAGFLNIKFKLHLSMDIKNWYFKMQLRLFLQSHFLGDNLFETFLNVLFYKIHFLLVKRQRFSEISDVPIFIQYVYMEINMHLF